MSYTLFEIFPELEAKIAGLDFDIEQEKQRCYTFLDADKIESYLNSVICGDIQEMPVRKLIVKTFVREVILDNDSVTITYNFTETYTKYKITPETLQQIKRQSVKKTANNKTLCSNKLPSLPPTKRTSIFACPFCFSVLNKRDSARCVAYYSCFGYYRLFHRLD